MVEGQVVYCGSGGTDVVWLTGGSASVEGGRGGWRGCGRGKVV